MVTEKKQHLIQSMEVFFNVNMLFFYTTVEL